MVIYGCPYLRINPTIIYKITKLAVREITNHLYTSHVKVFLILLVNFFNHKLGNIWVILGTKATPYQYWYYSHHMGLQTALVFIQNINNNRETDMKRALWWFLVSFSTFRTHTHHNKIQSGNLKVNLEKIHQSSDIAIYKFQPFYNI